MKKRFAELYGLLPGPVRRAALPAQAAASALMKARCPLRLLTGEGRHGGGTLTVAVAGQPAVAADLAKRFFRGAPAERGLGSVSRWGAEAAARAAAPDAALLVTEVPWVFETFLRPGADLYLPAWTRMELDLAVHAGSKPTQAFRNIRNIVSRLGLTREVARDAAAFDAFYRDQYARLTAERHDAAAVLYGHAVSKRDFLALDQELVLVKDGARAVGGAVLEYSGGKAHFLMFGLAADAGRAGKEAGHAVYFHLMERARERGFSILDMGYCRPFLSDGVMTHKRRWGAVLVPARSHGGGLWALRGLAPSPALAAWLRAETLVEVGAGDRYAVASFDPAEAARYAAPGVGACRLGLTPEGQLTATDAADSGAGAPS